MPIVRIDPGQHFSEAAVYGGLVYLAGHVSSNPGAGIQQQTADALAAIDATLAKAGTDKSHLLTVQIWMADISQFDMMNAAWDAWVDKANLPARATVEAKLAAPEYLIEIGGIAALP